MGVAKKPAIFVSSTCYDLKQIRADLKSFIQDQLGFEAVLSEFDSFPVDPQLDTIDNCLRVVNERADIFVLIIGNRYGYENDEGKSITNLEYLRAKAQNVPIYVFIQKNVLGALSIWKDNKDADFSSVVASPKVFEFIASVREEHKGWTYEFELAGDIISTLRNQLAYFFNDCIHTQKLFAEASLPAKLQTLDGNSLKIVLEKPDMWEYSLFGSVFRYELQQAKFSRQDFKYRIYVGAHSFIAERAELFQWLQKKFNEIQKIVAVLANLFNNVLQEALGPDGVPGNAEQLVYVAESIGRVYRALMDWGFEFDSLIVDFECEEAMDFLREIPVSVLTEIENYCDRYNMEIDRVVEILPTRKEDDEPIHLTLNWSLPELPMDKITSMLQKIAYG